MKKQVLFIQGAGEGAHKEDGELVKSLRDELGADYTVHYPQLPKDGDTEYEVLKERIAKELAKLDGTVIIVGHSAGCAVLVRYLSEEDVTLAIAGLFLIAAPYLGPGGWELDGNAFRKDFAARLPEATPIFFYHSRDDETVEFKHLALYKKHLPQATFREFDGRGHQFGNDLAEVAQDIKNLPD